MTVAAVIVCATAESALADAAGRPAVRRMVESAWAGGAVPVVVVAPDGGGAVASALAGSSAVLAEPAPVIGGPVAQIVRGMSVAREQLGDTEAALVWPGRMAWVGPETVTSLIEAHGPDRRSVLRPRFTDQLGWPVLVPLEHLPTLRSLPPEGMPDALLAELEAGGVPFAVLDLGDPGTTHDVSVALDALPAYEGPPEPTGGPPPDWGPAAADMGDETPLAGPSLAPYGQVADADRE